ncbi:antiviral reverse transcriptase Drt3a [Vibrio sp. VNB-15]
MDQSFNARNLGRKIKRSDFIRFPDLKKEHYKISLISQAVEFSETSHFTKSDFNYKYVNNKIVHNAKLLHHDLVIRKANDNIRNRFKIRSSDRNSIINQLRAILKEQNSYNIYKLDIKSFYESIRLESISNKIDDDYRLNYRTKNLVSNMIKSFQDNRHIGLPRGISLSATISEIIMEDFDSFLRLNDDIFYHARFVDDIVILTSGKEPSNFFQILEKQLPVGLEFNKEKKQIIKVSKGKINKDKSFSFLGYEIKINKNNKTNIKEDRLITLDIARSKVKKIKTRLLKSFINYQIGGDFKLLFDRVKLLTSNFSLLDKRKNIEVMSGIYYNYRLIDHDYSSAIKELDLYLKQLIHSKKNLSSKSSHSLNGVQRSSLLSYSFHNGFEDRHKIKFSPSRQRKLQRTWKSEK